MSTNITKTEFDTWLDKVDALFRKRTGLSIHDMPDWCWSDFYDDGLTPAEALAVAREDGFS